MLKYVLIFLVGFVPNCVFSQNLPDTNYQAKFPALWAHIGNYKNAAREKIEKYSLEVQKGVLCGSLRPRIHVNCLVTNYDISIVSNNQVIYSKTQNGPFFSKETLEQFTKVKAGDLIIIRNIDAKANSQSCKIPSIVYEVE